MFLLGNTKSVEAGLLQMATVRDGQAEGRMSTVLEINFVLWGMLVCSAMKLAQLLDYVL
jgi:hypothetical protein